MKLHDFYLRCRTADWDYKYADGYAFRSGRDAMEALRAQARQSKAYQHIFDEMQRAAEEPGIGWPEFGDVVPKTDMAALNEAIAYHGRLAQNAYTAALTAEERSLRDPDSVKRYHHHNAIANRLIGSLNALEDGEPEADADYAARHGIDPYLQTR